MLRVGDEILYRPSWGSGPLTRVRIERMEVTTEPRSAYGTETDEVSWSLVQANRVVFDLDNGKWAYSDAVDIPETQSL